MNPRQSRPTFASAALLLTLAGAASFRLTALAQPVSPAKEATPAAETKSAESTPAEPAPVRAIEQWNVDGADKLAIDGYDPVAYFTEGGGKPARGDEKITAVHEGVTYRFVNAKNREAFLAKPARYEPAHGGWCSWAMREGDKVDIDPQAFIVKDDRLFLFYKGWLGDTRSKWQKGDHAAEAREADDAWKKISGETPRAVKSAAESAAPATAARKSLSARLNEMSEGFKSGATAERLALFEQGIEDVRTSGVMEKALKVGDKAPEFELPDANGTMTSLASMLKKGPVVVSFYRGGWCPYCNLQLADLQDRLGEIKEAGGQLAAISPQKPDGSLDTVEKSKLTFVVMSDQGNTVAKKFGVVYEVPERLIPMYKPMLERANGEGSTELPLAATYVIARDGTVAHAFVDADYRKRAEPDEIIGALRKIQNAD